MDRVNQILQHDMYRECLAQIRRSEQGRIFCGHDMSHFLDVARLAHLFNLEEGLKIDREKIYAAALLHDIGRHIQYMNGTPHQEASVPLAAKILEDSGFDKGEQEEILTAILRHRDKYVKEEKNLAGIIYRADKMSRACYGCAARELCDWDDTKKNLVLEY